MITVDVKALIGVSAHRLATLQDKVKPGNCYTVEGQAESFRNQEAYIAEAQTIFNDLLCAMVEQAAGYGDQHFPMRARKDFRDGIQETVDHALADARSWAEEIEREYQQAAE